MPCRSAASLGVPVFETPRPKPPARLSQEAKLAWVEIVAGFRPDWFQGSEAVFETYVQDLVLARQLVAEVAKCEVGSEHWLELVRLHIQLAGSLVRAATALRLTPQSTRDSRNSKHVPPGVRPWADNNIEPSSNKPS